MDVIEHYRTEMASLNAKILSLCTKEEFDEIRSDFMKQQSSLNAINWEIDQLKAKIEDS